MSFVSRWGFGKPIMQSYVTLVHDDIWQDGVLGYIWIFNKY